MNYVDNFGREWSSYSKIYNSVNPIESTISGSVRKARNYSQLKEVALNISSNSMLEAETNFSFLPGAVMEHSVSELIEIYSDDTRNMRLHMTETRRNLPFLESLHNLEFIAYVRGVFLEKNRSKLSSPVHFFNNLFSCFGYDIVIWNAHTLDPRFANFAFNNYSNHLDVAVVGDFKRGDPALVQVEKTLSDFLDRFVKDRLISDHHEEELQGAGVGHNDVKEYQLSGDINPITIDRNELVIPSNKMIPLGKPLIPFIAEQEYQEDTRVSTATTYSSPSIIANDAGGDGILRHRLIQSFLDLKNDRLLL